MEWGVEPRRFEVPTPRLTREVARFAERLWEELVARDGDVIIDISRVEATDEVGLAGLARAAERLEARGFRMVLTGMRPAVRALAQLLRVHKVVDIVPGEREARRLLRLGGAL